MERIEVVATTISGSVKDWRKIKDLEREFSKHYRGAVGVHVVDSHGEARRKTEELVHRGSRLIVSAGGAGTLNSVLEGCYGASGIPEGLRLGFLRKGSADLIGKVLNIPDDLGQAVRLIATGAEEGHVTTADIIEISGKTTEKRRFLGFSGLGVFGEVPRFTENRFVKYYKGILGSLLGDLGPFLIGVNFALMKYHVNGLMGGGHQFHAVGAGVALPAARYISIIILNGDLGPDFPLAEGMPLGSGDFKVVGLADGGVVRSYQQLLSCWKGEVFRHQEQLGVSMFRTKDLRVVPKYSTPYMVNVDGLVLWAAGPISYRPCGQVALIAGRDCVTQGAGVGGES